MTEKEKRAAAKQFVSDWNNRGDEKQETQSFWLSLLQKVFGVAEPEKYIRFEMPVKLDNTSFIDGFIKDTLVLIEQKSMNVNLDKKHGQSDGSSLTPYEQARRYGGYLNYGEQPRWIIVCNFQEFRIHDMTKPNDPPEIIPLSQLEKEYHRLQFLVNAQEESIKKETEISVKAGELVDKLYRAILKQYNNLESPETLRSLNVLCVRLVFCLYAEDAGVFGNKDKFGRYLKKFPVDEVRSKLIELFEILNTPIDKRDPYKAEELLDFPYVNGGLFKKDDIEIPRFTPEIVELLVDKASMGFDWSEISPTIFGAVFESTLNPVTRRSGGMHYTSIENIHKVIDPLFLDQLKSELAAAKALKTEKTRVSKLTAFTRHLSSLTFLDPACGSGNFLTETYLSLRKLENEALEIIYGEDQMLLADEGGFDPIKVSISQFYGIEINDFAVSVATTALWIAELQMKQRTEQIIGRDIDYFPLKSNAYIKERNALTIDWESVVAKEKLSYIMGNPPFMGARLMSNDQKEDVFSIFDGVKKNGNLDYVSCWYKKSAEYMAGTTIRTALVSTNSITQGEQVAILWKSLFEKGVHIDFAHKTFIWDSEASMKAHVHCVIVGFSIAPDTADRRLFENGSEKIVKNINGYLVEADNVVIESRKKPICDVPQIGMGNQPIDDGNYLFTEEEMKKFISKEPESEKYFKKWLGAVEFINGFYRYCLWLGDCSPKELMSMPECMKRVENVRQFRLASKRDSTSKMAEKPTRFQTENMPNSTYILVPKVSSEKRSYVPMGFLTPDIMCSDLVFIIPNATLYHFGILTSSVHMAWMRAVAGRLKSDYRYSKDIVYNNFPWCTPTDKQRVLIEKIAQSILDARAKYPDCSLADMYGEKMYLFSDLVKAHEANDNAVCEAYGFPKNITESECVAELMKMYQKLTEKKE